MIPFVLVCDPCAQVQATLAGQLLAAGMGAYTCATLAEANDCALMLEFDAVVIGKHAALDAGLPKFLHALHARAPAADLPVVVWADPQAVANAHALLPVAVLDAAGDVAQLTQQLGKLWDARRPAPEPPTDAPRHLLLVDDDPVYASATARGLTAAGYEVVAVGSAAEALQAAQRQLFDGALVDLGLRGESGLEVCRQLRAHAHRRSMAVVVVTGAETSEVLFDCVQAGADDLVAKSAGIAAVVARVRNVLRHRQADDLAATARERLLMQELRSARQATRSAMALASLQARNAELAATNAQLAEAQQTAVREARFKSQFVASMSHELRTPLHAILGFAELLHEKAAAGAKPTAHAYVDQIVASARHLQSLVNDILDLCKIEADRMTLYREKTQLFFAIEPTLAICHGLAVKAGLALHSELPELLPDVDIDPLRIKQVFFNLVGNAIKYTPRGGTVHLRARQRGGMVAVEVTDTGIGIAPEQLGRLFEPFESLPPADGVAREGTGLGLALARRFVELHGGTIEVRSELGRGSTFTVWLPVAEADSPAAND